MPSSVSAKKIIRETDIGRLEHLANEKSKSRANLKWVQIALGLFEYFLYVVTFSVFFMIKVLPDYPGVSYQIWEWPGQVPVFKDYMWFILFFLGLYLLSTYQQQFYTTNKERNLSDEVIIIVKSITMSFMITIGITFLLKNTMVYSRLILILFVITIIVEATLLRYVRKRIFFGLKQAGKLNINILIIGAGRVGQQLQKHFLKSDATGLHFVGFLDDSKQHEDIIGPLDDLEKVVHKDKVDIIYITIPSERNKINPLLRKIYKYQIDIRIIPELYDHMSSIYEYRQDYDYPCLQVVKTPLRGLNQVIKRFMDLAISVMGLIILSPIFLVIAMVIKLTTAGPVIYRQKRLGINGAPFTMYKFRSMVHNAEGKKEQLSSKNEVTGPAFKMKSDPRITPIGAYIRKYSIDEFPQLFNVIKGEMSLIGPRPPLPEEVKQYSDKHWRRMDVRPGMTGLWQVSGRSDLTFDEWINLDIQYIERWSIALEFKIILKTIPVVIKGSGAY